MSGSQADFWQGPTGTLPVVNANGNIFEEVQVATAAQTVFTLATFTYTLGQKSIWVFRRPVATDIGGEMLRRTVDYVETASNKITLTSPAALGDTLIFIAFGVNQLIAPVVNNGIPQGGSAGAILTKNSGSDYDAVWTPQSAVTTLLDAVRQNVASASTINLVAIQSTTRNINITGNIQIDGFQITNGEVWAVRFSGVLTLKNNASISTQTNADIITATNATCFIRAIADNTVEVISYSAPNGPLLASSVNGGPFGRRNFFYNGGHTNSQRGPQVLAAPGTASPALDGWGVTIGGTTVSATITQVALSTASTGFALDIAALTTTGTANTSVFQRIEAKNSKKLSGRQITVSGKIRHGASTNLNLIVTVERANASDNFGATTVIANSTPAVIANGNVDVPFSSTFTLAASDADNGIQVDLQFTNIVPQTGVTVLFFDLQCEIGAIATPFEHVSVSQTDIDSKRYLYCTNYGAPKGGASGSCAGVAISTSIIVFPLKFPVGMRVVPTLQLWQNGTQNQIRNISSGATQANTISSLGGSGVHGFGALVMGSATLVAGAGYDFDIIASSEL